MGYTRREALRLYGLGGLGITMMPMPDFLNAYQGREIRKRAIPSTGESLPIVGLGTWLTFDVGNSKDALQIRRQVLAEMHRLGGRVVDSSPMYGSSEATVGKAAASLDRPDSLFYATKVWISGREAGIDQMNRSFERMGRSTMDLMQIHNLVDWKTHVKTLREWKEQDKIRYWGITHYVDSAHRTLQQIIEQEKPDFVQFNYSIRSRHGEQFLFDTCRKNDTAVIINQPYESGTLFRAVRGKALPDWASEYDIDSWGQFFLKFILSNPTVTCVIPGTSSPEHVIDNIGAGYGILPDEKGRERMASYVGSL